MTIRLNISEFTTKFWTINNQKHNKYGPTIEYAHTDKRWYFYGVLHRLDGPAVEWKDGDKLWYIDGVRYSYLEYLVAIEAYTLNKNI